MTAKSATPTNSQFIGYSCKILTIVGANQWTILKIIRIAQNSVYLAIYAITVYLIQGWKGILVGFSTPTTPMVPNGWLVALLMQRAAPNKTSTTCSGIYWRYGPYASHILSEVHTYYRSIILPTVLCFEASVKCNVSAIKPKKFLCWQDSTTFLSIGQTG